MCDTLCVANSYCCDSDINECQTDNGGCTQTCDNTDGSYQCSCWDGYELTDDRHSCSGKQTCIKMLYQVNATQRTLLKGLNIYAVYNSVTVLGADEVAKLAYTEYQYLI